MALPLKRPAATALPEADALYRALVAWFGRAARPLPWRATTEPWAIWISEIMLQQTQVDTVVPRFLPFLRRFPSPEAMAQGEVGAVCEAWAGLGYYRRARLLHRAAEVVVAQHGGAVPRTLEALLALPGVGRYTAGAIASIAWQLPAPIVDGNVVRVLSRLFMLTDTLATPAGRRALWAHATRLVEAGPGATAGAFNQALMELGRTVCTPTAPACPACPVQAACLARAYGVQAAYPVPVPKAAKKPLAIAFAWQESALGAYLWQRPITGKWAGLWEPPSVEGPDPHGAFAAQGITLGDPLGTVTYLLTHRRVTAVVYRAQGARAAWRRLGAVPVTEPLRAPLSTLARKAIVAAGNPVV